MTRIVDGLPRNREVFGDYVLRGDLMRSLTRFGAGVGRVAYLGGSVTMRPWRQSVQTWLGERFAGTAFDFVMAGVGGTPAELGAYRVEQEVFGRGPVDLLFVEFAVNGGGVRGVEGIVRRAKSLNRAVDIVMLYFASEEHIAASARGEVPPIVRVHERVAEAYALPALHLYREIARRVGDGRIAWGHFSHDSVHPRQKGSDIYAACLIDFLEAAWADPRAPVHASTPLPAKLAPDCIDTGGFVPYDRFEAVDGFSLDERWRPRFRVINIWTPLSAWVADRPGAALRVRFEGRACGLYYMSCEDSGTIEYRIDDGAVRTLDTFNNQKNMPQYRMLSEDLGAGEHTLWLRVGEAKHDGSGGRAVRIMQVLAR